MTSYQGALLACLVMAAFYGVVLSFISPNIVISKLHSDQLIYFTQAQYLARHGTLEGLSFGSGLGPVVYAPVASYVHALGFLLFDDIDAVIRAIQVVNVVILVVLGLLWWAYLRNRLPAGMPRLWCLMPFAWLCLRYTPWFSNAYLPLGDHIFAVLQFVFILVCLHLDWWLGSRARMAGATVLLAGTLAIAAVQKFTALALMGFLLAVLVKRFNWRGRQVLMAGLVVAVAVVAMCLGFSGLYLHYFDAGLRNNVLAKPVPEFIADSLLTLFGAALPGQLIPNFSYLFDRSGDPMLALNVAEFRVSWIAWLVVGLAISAATLSGAWKLRRRLAPELVLLILTVPVYAAITRGAGTVRYLAYTEPIFLVLFLGGALPLWQRVRARMGTGGALRGVVAATAVLGAFAAIGLGNSVTAGSAPVAALPQFLRQLDRDVAGIRAEISTIAGPDTLFLSLGGQTYLWLPVAGVSYVHPALAARMICEGREVYVVRFCDRRNCNMVKRLSAGTLAEFDRQLTMVELMYDHETTASEAVIRRLRLAEGAAACPVPPGSSLKDHIHG